MKAIWQEADYLHNMQENNVLQMAMMKILFWNKSIKNYILKEDFEEDYVLPWEQ